MSHTTFNQDGHSEVRVFQYSHNPVPVTGLSHTVSTFYMVMNAWGGYRILCEFTDTKVNTDNIVLQTTYKNRKIDGFVADVDAIADYAHDVWLDANSMQTSTTVRDTVVIQPFTHLYTDSDGQLHAVVVNDDGTTSVTAVTAPKDLKRCMVTDAEGDTLVINSDGQPMGKEEYFASNGNKAMLNDYHRRLDSTAMWQINFLPSDRQEYDFDAINNGNHGIYSDSLEYYPMSGNYDFRYKSVATLATDYVKVDFGSYGEKDSVVFKDRNGIRFKLTKDNTLVFTASSTADTNYIYAYDKHGTRIGKLFVKTYAQKTYKVVMVILSDGNIKANPTFTAQELQEYLNKIYHQCNVTFSVSETTLVVENLLPFTHGDKNRLSGYNDDQKRILEAFESQIEPDVSYLFFLPKGAETGGVAGYNPPGYNFGFIYDGAGERTVAHEFGHGIGSLRHPFDDAVNVRGNTANLMDYSLDGEQLYHFQWDLMQNPKRRIFRWRFDEEEGEMKDAIVEFVNVLSNDSFSSESILYKDFVVDGVRISVPYPKYLIGQNGYAFNVSKTLYVEYDKKTIDDYIRLINPECDFKDYNQYKAAFDEVVEKYDLQRTTHILNSPIAFEVLNHLDYKIEEFGSGSYTAQLINWRKNNWPPSNSQITVTKTQKYQFALASLTNRELDILSYNEGLVSDDVLFENYDTKVLYTLDELRYWNYGYVLSSMNFTYYEAVFAAMSFFDKERILDGPVRKFYPWLIDAMLDGYYAYQHKTNPYPVRNMYGIFNFDDPRGTIDLNWDLSDLGLDLVLDVCTLGTFRIGKSTLQLGGKMTTGAVVALLVQYNLSRLDGSSPEEAFKSIQWSNTFYSSVETLHEKWYVSASAACFRSALHELNSHYDWGNATETCIFSLVFNLLSNKAITPRYCAIIKKCLGKNARETINGLWVLGLDKDTIEWVIAKATNDYGMYEYRKLINEICK